MNDTFRSMGRLRGPRFGSLFIDEVKISKIDDRVEKIGEDKDWIHLPDSIGQKNQSPCQAKIPESYRDNTLFSLFRGNPLDDEPHRKHRLPKETKDQPEVQLEFWIPHRKVSKKIGHQITKS